MPLRCTSSGTDLAEVVSSRPEARAHYVCSDGLGGAIERELPVRYLGVPAPVAGETADVAAPPSLVVGGEALAA